MTLREVLNPYRLQLELELQCSERAIKTYEEWIIEQQKKIDDCRMKLAAIAKYMDFK